MKIKLIITTLLFLIAALIFYSCDTTEPGGDPPKPPGYQEDIPWTSLADSPWPIHRGNPQGTGRSNYIGPQLGKLEKTVNTPELQSGIVVGADSTLYFTSASFRTDEAGLYAYNPDGTFKWRFPSLHCWTSPIVAKDGMIFFMSVSKVYAVNPNGTLQWEYNIENSGGSVRPFSIGKDGTIYFLDFQQNLNALGQNGNVKWLINDERFAPTYWNSIVFSPDGNTIYMAGKDEAVISFDIMLKEVKWTFGEIPNSFTNNFAPTIDSDGNIYTTTKDSSDRIVFISLDSNGEVNWEYRVNENIYFQPTIDKNGYIYFTSPTVIYSLDSSGNLRWKLELGTDGGLVCDSEGTIYAADAKGNAYSIDNKGTVKWLLTEVPIYSGVSDSPSLFFDRLLIPSNNNPNFCIIK